MTIIAIGKATIISDKKGELRMIAGILENDFTPNEPGRLQYESFLDCSKVITIERWEDQKSLNVHLTKEHVKKYIPLMKKCIEDGKFNLQFIKNGEISFIQI